MKKTTGPDMSRNQENAGKVVEQGIWDVYYDEHGYATKAVWARKSPGYVVDGKHYPGEPKR